MPEHCLHAALGDILGPLLLLILLGAWQRALAYLFVHVLSWVLMQSYLK